MVVASSRSGVCGSGRHTRPVQRHPGLLSVRKDVARNGRCADRVYRRSARARQGPHTLRSDGLRLRSRARSPRHLAGCREPNPEIIQERENVLSLVRDGHDACARLDLVLASLCGSTNDPYKVFFPGVHARKFRSAPGGSPGFSRSPTDARRSARGLASHPPLQTATVLACARTPSLAFLRFCRASRHMVVDTTPSESKQGPYSGARSRTASAGRASGAAPRRGADRPRGRARAVDHAHGSYPAPRYAGFRRG